MATAIGPPFTTPYPFAGAPDIIRAHQKDSYFQGILANQLSDLHRRLLGARSAHAWAAEARTAADFLYLALTSLLGNRTLGEEYCGLVQVESPPTASSAKLRAPSSGALLTGPRLPALARRATYLASSILLPYLTNHLLLPRLRALLRASITTHLRTSPSSPRLRTALTHLLAHLPTLTSPAPYHAATLAAFYFSGAYYTLSQRMLGLRYVHANRVSASNDDAMAAAGVETDMVGYEVLGVLLITQLVVRGVINVRAALRVPSPEEEEEEEVVGAGGAGHGMGMGVDVSRDENAYASNTALLVDMSVGRGGGGRGGHKDMVDRAARLHTPVVVGGRYDLGSVAPAGKDQGEGNVMMGWIQGEHQRKCTLCMEHMRDPAAMQCGHVFCWACISEWVREKPECPLCRRETLPQHILPLRMA